jgi:lysophospholipase L1-like esterase
LRIGLAGLLVCCLGGIGCNLERSGAGGPAAPSPPPPGAAIQYAAVGASDVTGIGSSLPCLLTDCPDGMGYVAQAARQLRAQGHTVSVANLGIPTAVIGPGFQSLGLQYGRFIAGNFLEQEAPFVPRDAAVVTIFAGGNDVNVITAALGGGAGGSDATRFVDEQVERFADDYRALIDAIRARAGDPRIIALNLPNLAALPFLAGEPLARRQAAERASVRMTTRVINPLAAGSVIVVDLMCDARLYDPANLSSDGFHPNDGGYSIMAAAVIRAATQASYPAPQGSCSLMTVAR